MCPGPIARARGGSCLKKTLAWTAQDLSLRPPDLMRKRSGCGLDARTVRKPYGEAMVHAQRCRNCLCLSGCFGQCGSRSPNRTSR